MGPYVTQSRLGRNLLHRPTKRHGHHDTSNRLATNSTIHERYRQDRHENVPYSVYSRHIARGIPPGNSTFPRKSNSVNFQLGLEIRNRGMSNVTTESNRVFGRQFVQVAQLSQIDRATHELLRFAKLRSGIFEPPISGAA